MDAVDQIINYTFKGGEVLFRITGAAARNLAVLIAALLKDTYKTSGKTRMARFYREGKDQKVITIPREQQQNFNDLAKRYGILYCVIDDKRSQDLDLVVKTEDIAKVKRIYDRLGWGEMNTVADIEAVQPSDISKDANVITIVEPELLPFEQELADMEYKRDDLAAATGSIRMKEDRLREVGVEPDRFPEAEIEGLRNQVTEAEAALKEKYGLDRKSAEKEVQALDAKIDVLRKEAQTKKPTNGPDRSNIDSNGSQQRNNKKAPVEKRSVKQKLDEIVQQMKQVPAKQQKKSRAKVKAPTQEKNL